jgi:hypothetical protein
MKTKSHLVYLFGDLNASKNDPLQRKNTSNGSGQDRLLCNLLDHGGLIDTFPTWHNNTAWSSPDHILISAHARQHATASQISNVTVKLHGLDHNLLTTYIDIDGTGVIPKEDRTYINFDRKRSAEYMSDLDTELEQIPDSASTEDAAHAYFTKCITKAQELFTSKRGRPPKKTKQVLKILNDVN